MSERMEDAVHALCLSEDIGLLIEDYIQAELDEKHNAKTIVGVAIGVAATSFGENNAEKTA